MTDRVFSAAFERLAVLSHRMSGALARVDEKRCPTRYIFKGPLELVPSDERSRGTQTKSTDEMQQFQFSSSGPHHPPGKTFS